MERVVDSEIVRMFQDFVDSNANAKIFFSRVKDTDCKEGETNVDTIERICALSRQEAVQLAKEIDARKLGIFISGRRGGVSRVKWHYDPTIMIYSVENRQSIETVALPDQKSLKKIDVSPSELIINAKESLANLLGVLPGAIEITVKW